MSDAGPGCLAVVLVIAVAYVAVVGWLIVTVIQQMLS